MNPLLSRSFSDNRKSAIQNLKWLGLSIIAFVLVAAGTVAQAQQPAKVPRIGVVGLTDRSLDVFRQGLRDLGYIDGKNVQIIYRTVEGKTDRMPDLVTELLQIKVDILVLNNTTLIRAAQQATKTTPIVMLTRQDPVATGLVASLARPGGNLTGISHLTRDLSGKRLELLKEVVPRISRVGVLWITPTSLGTTSFFQHYEATARALDIELVSLQMHRPNPDLDEAFQVASKARVSALIAVTHATLNPHRKMIVNFAIKSRLPLMFESSTYVERGGLISYDTKLTDSYQRLAVYVDKILKGAKPADLPVEQPTKFELVINLKTAKQIGLTIPPNVLYRANKVIR